MEYFVWFGTYLLFTMLVKRSSFIYFTYLFLKICYIPVCSKPPASGAKELEDYPEIHGLVEKIRKIQSSEMWF